MQPRLEQSTFAETKMDSRSTESEVGSYGFLGRYRLDRMIGHGAMGAVFEAFDTTLGRTVAIKTLYTQPDQTNGGFDTAVVDAAILQEARTAATLNHPHIVTVYDAGRAPSTMLKRELPYVAMELLQGIDLRQRIAQRPSLGQREAVALVGKVALALDHAHKGGVLHRDIKPANVFLTKNGAPKILDFGLARFTSHAAQANSDTASEVIAGSPQYMSPEMVLSIKDANQAVDVRSDVYSLGVILYEMLCGKQPFTAPTLEQLQERIARTPAEAPHLVNSAIPRDLSRIMLQALAKKPADRYRSAGQLARELRRWGAGVAEGETLAEAHPHPAPEPVLVSSPGRSAIAEPLAVSQPSYPSTTLPPAASGPRSGTGSSAGASSLLWIAGGGAGLAALAVAVWLWHSSPPAVQLPVASTAAASKPPPRTATDAERLPQTSTASAPASESSGNAGNNPAGAGAPLPTSGAQTAPQPEADKGADGSAAVPAATSGRLHITAAPWGEVEVDGKKMGVSPPLSVLTMEPGEHSVTLRNADYAARTFRVKVQAGKTERVAHKFE